MDQSELFPQIEIFQQFLYEHEHLILGLSYALAKSARADHAIRDADLIAAMSGLARSIRLWPTPVYITKRRCRTLFTRRSQRKFRE